jgi:hypothetical protein
MLYSSAEEQQLYACFMNVSIPISETTSLERGTIFLVKIEA